ncbi:MAG: oligosaccharide flippase family protein [Parvibaculales bacterium]
MLKSLIRKLIINPVTVLLSGAVASQMIQIFATLFVARIFPPEYFGQWSLFVSIVAVLSIAACLRLENAVIISENEDKASQLIKICVGSAFGVACLMYFVFLFLYVVDFDIIQRIKLIYLMPLSVVLASCGNVFVNLLLRQERYNQIALSKVLQSGSVAGLNLLMGGLYIFGLFGFGLQGEMLILSTLLGQIVFCLYVLGKSNFRSQADKIELTRQQSLQLVREFKDFPTFSLPEALVGQIAAQLPVYALAIITTDAILGQYALAYKILMLPIALLGGAMSKVNFRNFSKAYNEGVPLLNKVLIEWTKAFVMALPAAVFLFFVGEKLLTFVFGDKWDIAGEYLSLLAFPLAITFIFSITSCLHVVLRLQHFSFGVAIVSLICKLAVVYFFQENHFDMVFGIFMTDVLIVILFNLFVLLVLLPKRQALRANFNLK